MPDLHDRIADIVSALEREGALGHRFKGPVDKGEIRFGTHGSLSIRLEGENQGSWYDHEAGEGGGPWHLISRTHHDAAQWLNDHNFPEDRHQQHRPGLHQNKPNPGKQHVVATYDYVDEGGKRLFQVLRWLLPSGKKTFSQQQPGPGKGGIKRDPKTDKPTMKGARYVPYHLDELVAAKKTGNGHGWRVYIPEGEKDVDRLRQWGLTATCNPGGAGKWRREYGQYFAGAEVVLLADNDDTGREHVAKVAQALASFATVIKIPELTSLPEKGDISDWIANGGTQGELEDLVDATEPWQPEPPVDEPPLPGADEWPSSPENDEDIGPLPAEFSEDALTLQFSAQHAADWRYIALWGKWMQWTGTHWHSEDTLHAFELARRICRRNSAQVERPGLARAVASARTVAAVERLARADRRHAMTFDQFDANDWVLSQSQTLDLKTGETYPPRREDHNTKITAVAADALVLTPLWTAFLDRITGQDKELQAYLQRVAGYCMTGVTVEHVLFFLYGTGANGKSVFLNTLRGIWGDYAVVASMETFIETRFPQHSADLAMMVGARLVIAQEVEKGKAWAEAKINSLTGGDPVTAHYMRQDYFTYQPKYKLMIGGNHKPSLRSVNEAVRRRFHLVPFTVTIPEEERDTELAEKLKAEWPGILAWALQGCLEWQRIGLASPPVVREASEAYFAEEDLIRSWIAECCCDIDNRAASESSSALYKNWAAWAVDRGEDPGSGKTFSNSLEECGFRRKHGRTGARFYGIALNPPEMSDEEAEGRYWQK